MASVARSFLGAIIGRELRSLLFCITQRQVRAALAATVVGTQSVLEIRSSDELYLSWQDERRTALGRYDSANLQDGSRTSSYQEAGYSTYDEAFLRNRTARSRSGSNGYQQAVRTQQLYNYHDLFTLPQAALGFDAQPDRLASRSAMPQVDRSIASVTIRTVADEQARQAAVGQERVAAPEGTPKLAPTLTVHSLIKRFTPAFIAKHRVVLHTWNQRLGHHPHVHALVPGSGPSLDGKRWITHRMTKRTRSKPARPFLVDNKRLSAAFQTQFIRTLRSLYRRGKLTLGGTVAELAQPAAWNAFVDSLLVKDWCVFIEPPPTNDSTPDQVLKYLARYMTGGPISDQRLVSCENGIVTFKARPGNKSKSKRQIDVKQSGVEFVRNWTIHILPKGFTKSRCYGGYSSCNRTAFIALCQQLMPPPTTVPNGLRVDKRTVQMYLGRSIVQTIAAQSK